MEPLRTHLVIHGQVQGVSYRASARDEATRLGLTGWVKNLDNGDVEMVVEGPTDSLDLFVKWCNTGPSAAQIETVHRDDSPATGEFTSFTVSR